MNYKNLLPTIALLFSTHQINTETQIITPITEFSLILQPSPLGGIGIFATHDITKGTEVISDNFTTRMMDSNTIPAEFKKYCIFTSDEQYKCPERFDRLEVAWFINHSDTPNIMRVRPRVGIAIRDIKAGEEILLNYNDFNEPDHLKEAYYKSIH